MSDQFAARKQAGQLSSHDGGGKSRKEITFQLANPAVAARLLRSRMSYSGHAPDYIVVVSDIEDYGNGFHDFAERVNRKLKAGYKLHGTPFNIERVVCQ